MKSSFGKFVLDQLLAYQSASKLNETEAAAYAGATSAQWSNWKKRGEVSKDGIAYLAEHHPGLLSREGGDSWASPQIEELVSLLREGDANGSLPSDVSDSLRALVSALVRTRNQPSGVNTGRLLEEIDRGNGHSNKAE